MELNDIRTLLLDLSCMTAMRHVLDNPAIAALCDLCVTCVDDRSTPESITEAYCRAYTAWLSAASEGRGGFAREALEALKGEETDAS